MVLVKLVRHFGTNQPGEIIGVHDEIAARLIKDQSATEVNGSLPENPGLPGTHKIVKMLTYFQHINPGEEASWPTHIADKLIENKQATFVSGPFSLEHKNFYLPKIDSEAKVQVILPLPSKIEELPPTTGEDPLDEEDIEVDDQDEEIESQIEVKSEVKPQKKTVKHTVKKKGKFKDLFKI